MRAGDGLELRGSAAMVAVVVFDAVRQRGPDAAFDGDVGVGLRVFGHGSVMEADEIGIAHHAGVAAGFEADLGIRSGSRACHALLGQGE